MPGQKPAQTSSSAAPHARQRIGAADLDDDGWLQPDALVRLAAGAVTGGGLAEMQMRNFAPCVGGWATVRLDWLSEMESGRTWRLQVAAPTDGAIIAEVTGVQRVAQTRPAATAAAATAPVGDGRWQRIFEAACEVIGRRGYGDASMREIARVAGLPIATMYQTIGAKEDLLFMITEGCMRQLFDTFQQGLGGDGTAEGRVREAISAYVDYIDRNRKYINLVYRETRSLSPANRERIFAIERDFAAKWRALLDTGVAEGALRCADTEFAAHALYFLCTIWALRHWALDGFDAAQVKTCLGDLVLDGLKPRTARDRRETA